MLKSESLFGWKPEPESCTSSGGKQSAGGFHALNADFSHFLPVSATHSLRSFD